MERRRRRRRRTKNWNGPNPRAKADDNARLVSFVFIGIWERDDSDDICFGGLDSNSAETRMGVTAKEAHVWQRPRGQRGGEDAVFEKGC